MSQSCKYKRGDRVAVYTNGGIRKTGKVTVVYAEAQELLVRIDGTKKGTSIHCSMKACRKLKKKKVAQIFSVSGHWASASEAVGKVTIFIPRVALPELHSTRGEMIFRKARI